MWHLQVTQENRIPFHSGVGPELMEMWKAAFTGFCDAGWQEKMGREGESLEMRGWIFTFPREGWVAEFFSSLIDGPFPPLESLLGATWLSRRASWLGSRRPIFNLCFATSQLADVQDILVLRERKAHRDP